MEENSERAIPFRSKWTRLIAAGTAVVAISTLISVSIIVPQKVIKKHIIMRHFWFDLR
jgi:hypothetical protein